jgi:23S rRNA pseudouridine1911/1915/1917 synthase
LRVRLISAITHYKVLEIIHGGLFSLVECKLDTGRTHQIRVHMSHVGHSIVGDQTYGNNTRKIHGCPDELKEELTKMHHQALHSFYMSFDHPTTGEKMEFEQELPEDYNGLLDYIRKV